MDKKAESIIYYILWPGDTEDDCDREMNQIGIESYRRKFVDAKKKHFHLETFFLKKDGYILLEKAIIDGDISKLDGVKIISSKGKNFTIEEMFDRINKVMAK